MRARAIAGAVATAGIIAGGVLGVTSATAGHENTVLTAEPDGRNEVDSKASNRSVVGDPNGRGELYAFNTDADKTTTLCYVLTVDKIAPASAAHIHEGRAGENGPVVVNLGAPADGNTADCVKEGTARVPGPAGTIADILKNPQDYYVNVHNGEFPAGALRDQLGFER